MRKIKYHASYGYVGSDVEDVMEFDDDATDEEIEESVREAVLERIDWSWEEDRE